MHLTKSEQEIMNLFWSVDHPMTQGEVVSSCENRSWKERSVFSMLNGLLGKGLIHEVSFVRSGKTYARTFEATMTQAEYLASVVSSQLPTNEYPALLSALLKKNSVSRETLEKLHDIVDEMMKQ